jgi:parallel beta-helix repeat protein
MGRRREFLAVLALLVLGSTILAAAEGQSSTAKDAHPAAPQQRTARGQPSLPPRSSIPPCTRYAAAWGSDGSQGSFKRPYRTISKLLSRLAPGQTGCLRAGLYVENVTLTRGGRPGNPITLTSAPRARATIRGKFVIADGADDIVVTNLNIDGRNTVGATATPIVNGDRSMWLGNDVTSHHTMICFVIGSAHGRGVAHGTVIARNRIHNCGRLPATNHDHGIYVEAAVGTVIRDNYIYGNADRGVQLYPNSQNTVVSHNVIDGNGEGVIFSGDGGYASSGNSVVANIISNSTIRANVESSWSGGGPVGVGNVVARNCLWNGRGGNIDASAGGFVAHGNIEADPLYVGRFSGDFRLRKHSPCRGKGPR